MIADGEPLSQTTPNLLPPPPPPPVPQNKYKMSPPIFLGENYDLILLLQIYTTRAGKDVLEAQGVHKCWPLLISFLLILLFSSRTIYDLVAVNIEDANNFGLGWTFATDMVSRLRCYPW